MRFLDDLFTSVCIKVAHPDILVYRDRLIGLSRGAEPATCVIDVLHEIQLSIV